MLSDRGMVILLTIYSEGTILCCVPMLTAWCRWKMPKRFQEVMLWLWENRGDLIIESSLNQYLFKMTYRRVLNHLTREQVKTKAEAAFYERTQAALCEVDYGRFEELDRKIKEAMAALPDSYREAFVMHRFKELSYKEIAEVLDVSPQTVAYRIQQALKLLRVSLKDYLPMLVWLVG